MKERTAVIGSEHYTVTWTESEGVLEATVNGRQYRLHVRKLEDGGFWFGWNGRSAEIIAVSRDEGYDVGIDGRQVRVEFLESNKRLRRQGAGSHSGIVEVRAPMPGKIVRVLSSESQQVKAKQGIVVIEAMKMQNEIRSPRAGRITELAVSAGDAVGLGDLIARVDCIARGHRPRVQPYCGAGGVVAGVSFFSSGFCSAGFASSFFGSPAAGVAALPAFSSSRSAM